MLRCTSKELLSSSRRAFSQSHQLGNVNGYRRQAIGVNNGLDIFLSTHYCNAQRRDEDDHSGHQRRCLHTYASPLLRQQPSKTISPTPTTSFQTRCFLTEMLPEAMQGFTIWGASGWLLKTFHMDGAVPYWACFSLINILVRLTLFPLVLYSAHTAAKFGKVAAEIQFFVSMFQNDYKQTKARGASTREMMALLRMGMESLRGVYKLHNINPLSALLSPLLQIPFFIYMSVDLRKIVNGRDPELAQELTDCPSQVLSWVPDLTEPDPFYILPIIAGTAMYVNIETAIGKKTLAGDAAAKADMSFMLKDLFQSVAVFMPCFASHNPAGMQVYLCTSFVFTTIQGYALRNEQFRGWVGLPSRNRPPEAPKYGMTFIEMKELERKAEELRGEDGPILGEHIMAKGWRLGMPGTKRESTIEWTGQRPIVHTSSPEDDKVFDIIEFFTVHNNPGGGGGAQQALDIMTTDPSGVGFIHGVTAPLQEQMERAEQTRIEQEREEQEAALASSSSAFISEHHQQQDDRDVTDEIMEKANRGERPIPTMFATRDNNNRPAKESASTKVNPKRLAKLARKTKKGKKKSKR